MEIISLESSTGRDPSRKALIILHTAVPQQANDLAAEFFNAGEATIDQFGTVWTDTNGWILDADRLERFVQWLRDNGALSSSSHSGIVAA